MAFVLPVTVLGAVGIPGAIFIAGYKLFETTLFGFLGYPQLAIFEAAMIACVYASGRLTRWMVATAALEDALPGAGPVPTGKGQGSRAE